MQLDVPSITTRSQPATHHKGRQVQQQVPHYSEPLQRDALPSPAQERVQAVKLQRRKDDLLIATMEDLAETLCQQYLATVTGHRIGDGDDTQAKAGVSAAPDGTASAVAAPRTPDAIPLQQIHQQVQHMQFHIQQALLSHLPTGTSTHPGGFGVSTTATPPTTYELPEWSATANAMPAPPRLPRPPPGAVLSSRKLLPLGATSEARVMHAFSHSTSVPINEDEAAQLFDLPYSAKHQDQRRGHGGGSSRAAVVPPSLTSPRHRQKVLVAPPLSSSSPRCDTTQPTSQALAYLPNYHAVRSMIGEAHGMSVGHVQPLLNTLAVDQFTQLDCSLDGNTRCLSKRKLPVRTAVEEALRAQPVVVPARLAPERERILRTLVGPSPPPEGYAIAEAQRRAAKFEVLTKLRNGEATPRESFALGPAVPTLWSPRQLVAERFQARHLR